jgi:hypothetical protein
MLQIRLHRLAKNTGQRIGTKIDQTRKTNHISPKDLPTGCLVSMSFTAEPIRSPAAPQIDKNSGVVSLFIYLLG